MGALSIQVVNVTISVLIVASEELSDGDMFFGGL